MTSSPDEHTSAEGISDERLAELLSAHRTEDMAAEDARVVAAFYMTLLEQGVCQENDDVVSLTARWMSYTWNGGNG